MEFEIINNENVKVILMENGAVLAKATCYFGNTPEVEAGKVGTIGEFEAKMPEAGVKVLEKCEEILREKGAKFIVAPMNGNTWHKYRTLKYSNGDPEFILENVNPAEHNEILEKAGFKELYTYTSTKGLLKDAYDAESLDLLENRLSAENIVIRKFDKTNYMADLRKIYNISVKSFDRNPFYTPAHEAEFVKQYEPYINMVDKDFILIAEKDGQEIGFIFCIPNFNELKIAGKIETVVVKTVAVLAEYQNLAIGNILLRRIAQIAQNKNFEKWIFAFMYSDNTSQKMAKRNRTKCFREYALFGKEV